MERMDQVEKDDRLKVEEVETEVREEGGGVLSKSIKRRRWGFVCICS